jgi:lipopolysaccharide/colanic/teichoic acid biosynthesis glycosyltransferase
MTAKRVFDFSVSCILLVLFALPLGLLYVSVLVLLGKPVIYRSTRPGLHGRLFTLYKFRTMTDEVDDDGELLPDGLRLTRFGTILRSLSLDELPELVNVIQGDMSLVGPRPLLPEYLARYSAEEARRHEVRPGITGLAQVSGRNALDWEERLRLDVWYVDHRSFVLDLRILVRTIASVLARAGISAEGHATMPELRASEDS